MQGDLVGYGKFRLLDFALGVAHQRKQGSPRIPDIQRFNGSGHGLLCWGNVRHADVFEDKMVVHQRIGNIPELHVGILWSLGRPCADGVNDGVFKIAHPAVSEEGLMVIHARHGKSNSVDTPSRPVKEIIWGKKEK